jgi:hypothetical protein
VDEGERPMGGKREIAAAASERSERERDGISEPKP